MVGPWILDSRLLSLLSPSISTCRGASYCLQTPHCVKEARSQPVLNEMLDLKFPTSQVNGKPLGLAHTSIGLSTNDSAGVEERIDLIFFLLEEAFGAAETDISAST